MTLLGNVWKAEDNRDNLEKAGKYEIWKFAQEKGVREITYEMPTQVARKILRAKGVTDIGIPNRPLGADQRTVYNAGTVEETAKPQTESRSLTADELIEQEYRQDKFAVPQDARTPAEMSMTELRQECKRRGIKMARTDNMNTLREKLG